MKYTYDPQYDTYTDENGVVFANDIYMQLTLAMESGQFKPQDPPPVDIKKPKGKFPVRIPTKVVDPNQMLIATEMDQQPSEEGGTYNKEGLTNSQWLYKDKMFPHQRYLFDTYNDALEIPVFADAGTGKSLVALSIASAKYERGEIDSLLIVAPNGVHKQWAIEQVPLWLKYIPYMVTWRKNDAPLPFYEHRLNIVCVNIDSFSTVSYWKKFVEWHNAHRCMIVLDEATKIKNPKAQRSQRLLYEFNEVQRRGKSIINSILKSSARMILTGTPITNGPFDVWSMFEFLRPNYFNCNYFAFCNRYGMYHTIDVNGRAIRVLINEETWHGIKACPTYDAAAAGFGVTLTTYDYICHQDKYEGPYRHIEELRKEICRLATFIRIEDCSDMPERTYDRRLIDMTGDQLKAYRDMERYLLAEYRGKEVSARTKLTSYIRLQQIASGFIVSDPEYDPEQDEDVLSKDVTWFDKIPKIDSLLNDIEAITGGPGIVTNNNQVIVVCNFSAESERLYEKIAGEGYSVCIATGWLKQGIVDKKKVPDADIIESFKKGKYQVMVANERVIAMGFNLQALCHHMLFYSNSYSLEDRLQVEARIYRTGQQNTCKYIDYIMVDSIEMKKVAALKQKKSLADYVRDTSVEEMLEKIDDVFTREYSDVVW